jgi:hypothetical protein
MKMKTISETRPNDDFRFSELTRDDLDPDEQVIYDAILPKLTNPSPEQLRMLPAYSWAVAEMRKAGQPGNEKLFVWLRKCSIGARNGLGLFKPLHVDFMELLLDWEEGWPPVYLALDSAWEVK